ncbi:TIGR01777 family oxidoreductase [Marinimicrobium alkaliphilum]|uniref:TIGR01777 family oxidoreductase n=1 Tax=Marinimicrobium alkaliphilum TaxID=2202654 RepID=UPI000DBA91EC|nr:TIGR01777 family oxidoreductase [Marinimicrobium alkaliphilum]
MQSQTEKSVLVTGGTGFVGVPLCRELNRQGYRVTVLSRSPERARALLGEGVTCVGDWPVEDVHAVINLAGEPLASRRWTRARKAEFRRSRIGTTEDLRRHCGERGQFPAVLINGSAVGYYGNAGEAPVDEQSPSGTGFAAELCRDWEAEAMAFAEQGTRVCTVRTGIVLGRDGGALKSMLLPFRLGLGGRLGNGRQWMSWIHRDDLVGLILWALENAELEGPINGTAPHPVTNRAFTRALGKAVNRPAIFPVPAFALRLLMGELADELLLASQRVLPKVAESNGYEFRYPWLPDALADVVKKNG